MNSVEAIPENRIIVGRGATAIYLVVKKHLAGGSEVMVPANICPAAVFPIIYAGCRPIFCDVSDITGNVTLATVEECANSHDIECAILPHMYGNPIAGFDAIIKYLKGRHVLVIEDCASSLGAIDASGQNVGFKGDYSIYSFGHSKIIDVGIGGMLASSTREVSDFHEMLGCLPLYSQDISQDSSLVSQLYRTLRNTRRQGKFESSLFRAIIPELKPLYINRLADGDKESILQSLDGLADIISKRREEWIAYYQVFQKNGFGSSVYVFSPGAVPWRFNFLVPDHCRQVVIDRLLADAIPVSDWYPSIERLFVSSSSCSIAESIGRKMLNLPILVGMENAKEIATHTCAIINTVIKEYES